MPTALPYIIGFAFLALCVFLLCFTQRRDGKKSQQLKDIKETAHVLQQNAKIDASPVAEPDVILERMWRGDL